MFKVYGLNDEIKLEESKKWYSRNSQEYRESDEEYQKRHNLFIENLKPKALKEFDVLSVAEKYMDMCRNAGFADLSIKFPKLVPGTGERLVSKTWVDVSELNTVDVHDQARLRSML